VWGDCSHAGVPIEQISCLVGHSGTTTTETVYRKRIRPVLIQGADATDAIFPAGSRSRLVTHLVTQRPQKASYEHLVRLVNWSGWPDLNRRPLRPEPGAHALESAGPARLCRSVSMR
jgi:hypothetical protein